MEEVYKEGSESHNLDLNHDYFKVKFSFNR